MAQPAVSACSRAEPAWPRAAIFDCDGLLVDSGSCWERAYAAVVEAAGRSLADLDLVALDGASVGHASAALSAAVRAEVTEAALREALRRSLRATPPRPRPGAAALTRALAGRMPLAVASNAPRDVVESALAAAGLATRFAAIVSAEETPAHKPAPDVYLEACRRLCIDPSDAVAFEDSPRGAEAARRAGLLLVGVPSRRRTQLEADLVVGRLDDRRIYALLGLATDVAPAGALRDDVPDQPKGVGDGR